VKYRWGKKPNSIPRNASKHSRGNQVSMLDTKTGGPMGVLDSEDLRPGSKQNPNWG